MMNIIEIQNLATMMEGKTLERSWSLWNGKIMEVENN